MAVFSSYFWIDTQTEVNWEVFAAAELTEFDELSDEEFLEDEDEKEANEKKWAKFKFHFD